MRLFNLWPWQAYHKSSIRSFHKRYDSSELCQGDARSQECADFRCGEWQPWWLSNCCSVVIENMFLSAGETQSISENASKPQQKSKWTINRSDGWFKSLCWLRSPLGLGSGGIWTCDKMTDSCDPSVSAFQIKQHSNHCFMEQLTTNPAGTLCWPTIIFVLSGIWYLTRIDSRSLWNSCG